MIHWRISRPRPAPIAKRSAISLARAGARLVNRLATLMHAVSSTAIESVINIAESAVAGLRKRHGCVRRAWVRFFERR